MIRVLTLGAGGLWTSFVYGLQRGDPTTYLLLGLIIAGLALVAARRPKG